MVPPLFLSEMVYFSTGKFFGADHLQSYLKMRHSNFSIAK